LPDFIKSLAITLDDFFVDKWEEKFSLDKNEDEQATQANLSNLSSELISIRRKIFLALNKSVLIGEFINAGDFRSQLNILSKKIASTYNFLPPDGKVQEFLEKYLRADFIEIITAALNAYLDFFIRLQLRFEFTNKFFVESVKAGIEKTGKKVEFDEEAYQDLQFFEANLTIANLDVTLEPEAIHYRELDKLEIMLVDATKLGGNQLSLLLKQKVDYLKIKWIIRQQHLNQAPIYSIQDNTETEINIEDFSQNPFFNYWRRYIESHYELLPTWKAEIQKGFERCRNKDFKDFTLLEIHRYIKFSKDVQGNKQKLSELRKELQRRYNSVRNTPANNDQYALAIALVYAINNEFSFVLEVEGVENESVENLYNEIQEIQSSTGIRNFFAQYKYLVYLVGRLEEIYNARKAMGFIAPARRIIDKCEKIISTYRENILWSQQYYNYAFHLTYNESLIETSSDKLDKIFLFSSFLLPLSKEKYRPQFEENSRRVFILKNSIEVFENIEPELSQFSNLKSEIQNRDVKSMEIIGIFTAIVTFIAGALPAFKYIETAYQAFLFMISLSLSLCFFVLLILSISRGIGVVKRNGIWIILFLIAAIVAWAILIFYVKDPHPRTATPITSSLLSLIVFRP